MTSYTGSLTIKPGLTIKQAKVINNFDKETAGAPNSYCDFKVNEDGDIEHDGAEKTRDDALWLKFILAHLSAIGQSAIGTIEVTTGYTKDYDLIVNSDGVFVQEYVQIKGPLRRV